MKPIATRSKLSYASLMIFCRVAAVNASAHPYSQSSEVPVPFRMMQENYTQALEEIYTETNGDTDWIVKDNWMNNGDPCDPNKLWHGVMCSGEERVIGLRLNGNNLSNTIPAEIQWLGSLRSLELQNNNLTGTLPSELGVLTRLTTMILNGNQFTGSIPTEIGLLQDMLIIGLNDNKLSGSIPSEIGNASQLIVLKLQNNSIEGSVPTELVSLSNLSDLRLSNNLLEGTLSGDFWSLTSMTTLYLDHNQLVGTVSNKVGDLNTLRNLQLHYNSFSGSLPSEIWSLSYLRTLKLQNNYFSGSITSNIGLMSNMEELQVQHNALSGSLPSEIQKLTNAAELDFSFNRFSGTVPDVFGNVKEISIRLETNLLTGEITDCGDATISADCGGSQPEVICSCCGDCYTSTPTPAPTPLASIGPTAFPTPTVSRGPTSKPSDKPSVGPSPSPSSKLSPDPSPSPSSKPSPDPSPSPSVAPIGSQSSKPSPDPSNQPSPRPSPDTSETPTIDYLTEEIVKVNYEIQSEIQNDTNADGLNSTLVVIDEDLEAYFNEIFGASSSGTRRLMNEGTGLKVKSVQSRGFEKNKCDKAVCNNITTEVVALFDPDKFDVGVCELYVHNIFLDFIEHIYRIDSAASNTSALLESSTIIPPDDIKDVAAMLSYTFIGVTNKLMTENETKDFADVTEVYYREQLLLLKQTDNATLVALKDVQVVGQSLSKNGEESRTLRHRYLDAGDNDYVLTVDTEFYGRYVPPPVINFGAVVVEVFEDDDSGEYVKQITNSPLSYFYGFDGTVSLNVQNEEPVANSFTSEESEFGGVLGKNGVMAITIVLWSVLWAAVCYMLWIKFHLKSMEQNKTKWRQSSRPDNSDSSQRTE